MENMSEVSMKSEFCALTNLPNEILEYILSCREISHLDICRIAQVSRKLLDAANSSGLWRHKFSQAWVSLFKLFEGHDVDWKHEFHERYKYEKIVTDSITVLRGLNTYSTKAQNFALGDFRKFFDGHRFASHFYVDALERRLNDDQNSNTNLTNKYYCRKLLHFARQEHILKLLSQLINETGCSKIETGLYLIAHFCQPGLRLSQEAISNQLDEIALQVKIKLQKSCPKHKSLCKDLIPSVNIPNETLWTNDESIMILQAISTMLFEDLKFRCVSINDSPTDHIFINQVLETKIGTPVLLSVIYIAVAQRLGLQCVHMTGDFRQLKCVVNSTLGGSTQSFLCVDVPKNGAIDRVQVDITEDTFSSPDHKKNPLMFSMAMVDYIDDYVAVLQQSEVQQLTPFYESCALELQSYLSPNSAVRKIAYVTDLLEQNVKLFDVSDLLKQTKLCEDSSQYTNLYTSLYNRAEHKRNKVLQEFRKQERFIKEPTPKKWSRAKYNVSYAIGMIMIDERSQEICVINDWDITENSYNDHGYVVLYHVLTEGRKQGYKCTEELSIHPQPRPVEHSEIGRFFEEFRGTHYVPNKAKAAEYPEDVAAMDAILEAHNNQLNDDLAS